MASYSTNEFKQGLKVMVGSDPCTIIENQMVKPGKGQAFSRVKFRNLKNGKILEKTLKSGESLPAADVEECEAQYLYEEGGELYFMHNESFEQYTVGRDIVGASAKWLKEQDNVSAVLWQGVLITIEVQAHVSLKVEETEPAIKGDTVSGAMKVAKLETGAEVRVPLFIEVGDTIKIDTRTESYLARA